MGLVTHLLRPGGGNDDMKLFVVLLAVGLSSSEKLHRAYLPPAGAKFSGGNLEDLQTPLKYPEETQIWSGNKARPGNIETVNTFENTAGGSDGYARLFETAKSTFELDIGDTQSITPGVRYPIDQEGINDFGNGGYYYGKPNNMPIIALTENIISNYNPNAFGMYGGSPMIIKTYTESPQQANANIKDLDHNEKHLNHISDDLYTSDEGYYTGDQKSGYGSQHKIDQQTIINQVNQAQNAYVKRPERVQAESDRSAVILDYDNVLTPETYSYNFDTSNGIHKDESATITNGVKALGSYSYTGDDGKVYSVTYSADENGFQPRGDHLPTPPPIPEAIQEVIEQAKKDKDSGIYHDGSYDEAKYGYMKYQGPINRYLQNMQINSKLKIKNRVVKLKNINTEPAVIENKIEEKNIQRNKNVNTVKRPVNDLNGQFGLRKVLVKHTNAVSNLDGETISFRRPASSIVLVMPKTTKHDLQRNIAISNNEVPSLKKYQGGKSTENNNASLNKINAPQDAGYSYVPPRKVFVEGRFQDLPTAFEPSNQFIRNKYKVEGKKSPALSGLYYVDQRKNYSTLLKNLSPITNTENPTDVDKQTNGNYVYKSTTQDVSQLTDDFDMTTKATSTTVFMSTHTSPGDAVSTSDYDQYYTEGILHQEETMFPEEKAENDIPFTKYSEQDLNNVSTTPIASEEKHKNNTGNPYQYEEISSQGGLDILSKQAVNLDPEGYFRTTPEVPATFEEYPSAMYAPTSTVGGVQTESIPIIKVDGFGRPLPDDSQLDHTNKLNYGRFTEVPLQDDETNGKRKSTGTFFNLEDSQDKTVSPEYVESITAVSGGSGAISEPEESADGEYDKIIGEDFSGPKKPQGYDPRTGYFY